MSVPILQLHSPIELLLSRPALVVEPGMPLAEVAQLMLDERVSAVLVESEPLGVLTERDMVSALAGEEPGEAIAAEVSSTVTVAVSADTDILDAATIMLDRGLRHIVVRLGEHSYAIVSLQEITVALVQAVRPERWISSVALRFDVHNMGRPTSGR